MIQDWREKGIVIADRQPAPAGHNNPSTFAVKDEVVKIFIGASEDMDEAALKVLKYSLLKNTQAKLDITVLRPSMFKDWNTEAWGTPFSCFRYAIPSLCEGKGRAIYMDVDMINNNEFIIIECYRKLDQTDFTDIYNDMWLKKYATELVRYQWGSNLVKLVGVQLPGGVSLNGDAIMAEAKENLSLLEEEMSVKYELPMDFFIE